MTDPVALAVSLARPVVRGLLPIDHAGAAIAAAIARDERAGTSPGSGTFAEKLAIVCHIMGLNIEREENRRAKAAHDIWQNARPMIQKGAARGAVRAQAHNINAEHNRAFEEHEVEDVLLDLLASMEARAKAEQRAKSPWRPRRYHVR